jgi:CHAT domain-containing protein
LAAFRSGQFDVLHYAGHAFFDDKSPSLSGIVCAHHQVLTGAELANVSRLPSLVFFNACESGRVRHSGATPREILRNVGLAEAFLRGGVPNYVGTYWPVGDAAAEAFASEFYQSLLQGQPIGEALGRARGSLYEARQVDWANYVLYGPCDFALKRVQGA